MLYFHRKYLLLNHCQLTNRKLCLEDPTRLGPETAFESLVLPAVTIQHCNYLLFSELVILDKHFVDKYCLYIDDVKVFNANI